MPKYTFICEDGHSEQKITSSNTKTITCSCGKTSNRALPKLKGPSDVKEIINKYTGTTWSQDQQQNTQYRRSKYYWEVEVPRLVQSGTYSLDTMLENEWIWVDDNDKIHIHTKPPADR